MSDDGQPGAGTLVLLRLLLEPPFGWIFAGLFGALWGSFWNVAIHRLGREDARLRDVAYPASHCPACGHPIRARDNVPILGWLILRGRCRDCRAPISVRYPLTELLGALVGLAVYLVFVRQHPDALSTMYARFFVYFSFTGTLAVLALIDLETMLLPEAITLPGIPVLFLLGRALGDVPLVDALVGAAVGYGSLKGLQLGYAALTGREGIGGGDPMLLALIGGFLGWKALPFTLGLGSVLGTFIAIPLLLLARRRGAPLAPGDRGTEEEPDVPLRHVEVPFGPFLVLGALVYLFGHEYAWGLLVDYSNRP